MPSKVKWVNSWKDIPKEVRERNQITAKTHLHGLSDRGVTYLIRGKSAPWVAEHEEYHHLKKHPSKERNPRDFALHELQATIYAYNKTGQPKHILSQLRAIYNDLRINIYKCNKSEALSAISSALKQIKAPSSWVEDYKKLKQLTN
jgi:hypothetical protein